MTDIRKIDFFLKEAKKRIKMDRASRNIGVYLDELIDMLYEKEYQLFYTLFPQWENCKLDNPDWFKSAGVFDYINCRAIEEVTGEKNGLEIVGGVGSFAERVYWMAEKSRKI